MTGSEMQLRAAIRRNDIEALKREVELGVDVNRVEKRNRYESILQGAAENSHVKPETLQALVDAGASPRSERENSCGVPHARVNSCESSSS